MASSGLCSDVDDEGREDDAKVKALTSPSERVVEWDSLEKSRLDWSGMMMV